MSGWTVAWILWGFAFVVIELTAFADRDTGDTLSEHIWRGLTRPGRWWTWPARIVVVVFAVWMAGHLAFHWWWV